MDFYFRLRQPSPSCSEAAKVRSNDDLEATCRIWPYAAQKPPQAHDRLGTLAPRVQRLPFDDADAARRAVNALPKAHTRKVALDLVLGRYLAGVSSDGLVPPS